jgi:site-specific DNA recombinase
MTERQAVRAVIYVRISRDKRRGSLQEGVGVREQEGQCRALADRLGYRVVRVFCDNDISAYSGRPRPDYLRMVDFIREGKADVLLCWHTDRLHRSNVELEDYINLVEPRGVKTETVTAGIIDLNTPMGRMVARQLCTIARYESEHRAERVAMAKVRQARQGKYGGGQRPFGFEPDGITPVPSETEVIARMGKAVLAGVSLSEIARDLRTAGILTARGTDWRQTTVRAVLLRPRNAGLMVHRVSARHGKAYTDDDIVGSAPWDPIIKEDDWRSIVRILTDPGRLTHAGVGPAPKHLGSGIYRCVCGATMRASMHTTGNRQGVQRANRRVYLVYRCPARGAGHTTVSATEADDFVQRVVVERMMRRDAASLIPSPGNGIDIAALQAELVTHRRRLDEIAADHEEDRITRSQFLTQTESRRKKLRQVEDKLAQVPPEISPLTRLVGAENVKTAWVSLTLGEKRAALKSLFTIRVIPSGKGRHVKIQDRLVFDPPERRSLRV